MDKMKVVIIGTGAIACLFGAELSQAADVTLAGTWKEKVCALNNSALKIKCFDGSEKLCNLSATFNPEELYPADLVIVAVKSYQTERAAEWARMALKHDGLALTIQNGLGNIEILKEVLGAGRCAAGVTHRGANISEPGILNYCGDGETVISPLEAGEEQFKKMIELFKSTGIKTNISDNIKTILWGKACINCAINPVTAILKVKNGALIDNHYVRSIATAAAKEAQQVAESLGITLPYPDAATAAISLARKTAKNKSSMLMDVLKGRRTEIESICGQIVKEAKKLKISTPVNEVLLNMLLGIEKS